MLCTSSQPDSSCCLQFGWHIDSMKVCASIACNNSAAHLVKLMASVCEKHNVPHGNTACNFRRPFHFFHFKDWN